jgi:thiol-disulfide isomerase/thioredoxin
MNVHIVEKEQELKKWISEPNRLVMLYYTASWCQPCQTISPVFDKLALDNPDVICVKIDVDVFEDCNVKQMPTFNIYYNGHILVEFAGGKSNLELQLSYAKEKIIGTM